MRAYPPNMEVFEAAAPPYTAENKGQLVYDLAEYNAIKSVSYTHLDVYKRQILYCAA